jgi:2-polyprenyl-3-methyl-5-hydroxy-6-metoxy-1,4-benzoquinol methylase
MNKISASQENDQESRETRRDRIKRYLKAAGLYRGAVYFYSTALNIYAQCKNEVQFLRGVLQNTAYRKKTDTDGLPFPPARVVYLVTNTYTHQWFYDSGIKGSQCIRTILKKNNFKINKFSSILDFGCGCGRIMRHWKNLNGPKLYGSDYNPKLVKWCASNLPFAEFATNPLESGFNYEDEKFDFIYAISVFTHLTEKMGLFWIRELDRVLKPKGVMYLTFMGTTRALLLRKELRDRFEAGQIVVTGSELAGKNTCAAFHPEQYVRNVFAKGLNVLDFVPGGATDAFQDVFLLQKKSKYAE